MTAVENEGATAAPSQHLLPFREIWLLDFEFHGAPEKSWVVCMVAREFRSGRVIRMWRDELLNLRRAPFDVGPDAVIVAYYASAEIGCFLALGWPLPTNLLDLFTEHRCATNGLKLSGIKPNSLVSALRHRGLPSIGAEDKDTIIKLIISKRDFSDDERRTILDYCESDVDALRALLSAMAPAIELPQALLRGRYMAATARMEAVGIPVDVNLHEELVREWEPLKGALVATVSARYGDVYDGLSFRSERFRAYLTAQGILQHWPTDYEGKLIMDDQTFREMAQYYPGLQPLHELRGTLGRLRLTGLQIGSDQRNRVMLSAFGSTTGRNQPSNTRFIFGPATWMRGLIRPEPGQALAYIDWSSQEIGIAAGLSGDERLIDAYKSGDIYMAFARDAKLVPPDATKQSHPDKRAVCKTIVLGLGYGMGDETMAARAHISVPEARELLQRHKAVYKDYWKWSEDTVSTALYQNEIATRYGWRQHINVGHEANYSSKRVRGRTVNRYGPNARSLMNFPMQAGGAEAMRLAAIAATEAGIEVCAPVHDAFLITAPIEKINEDTARMGLIMSAAGQAVAGLPIATDVKQVLHPDRYMDERGAKMWETVQALLAALKQRAAE
jgi:DNA polymerase I